MTDVERALARFLTPRRAAASAREAAVLARAGRGSLALGGPLLDPAAGRVELYDFGAGPTTLLVHGWGGRAAQWAALVEALLTRGRGVLAFDAPAHGASPGERTTLFELEHVIAELARTRGPLDALVGHSLGGAAILMRLAAGLEARRAVLIAPTPGLAGELTRFSAAARLDAATAAGVDARLRARLGADLWERTRLLPLAPRVRTPTLVVHDEHDPAAPLEASAELAAALPRGELHATRGLGHHSLLRTNAVVQRVAEWISAPDG